jgi:predicted anti-sigma-YlaC factor YlaD
MSDLQTVKPAPAGRLDKGGFLLSCRYVTEVVTEYLEGKMSFRDRIRFQMHLGMCAGCRRYLNQIRLTAAATGRLAGKPVPPDVEKELLERFRNWKKKA